MQSSLIFTVIDHFNNNIAAGRIENIWRSDSQGNWVKKAFPTGLKVTIQLKVAKNQFRFVFQDQN